jgi:hypothetical protein
MNSAQCCARDRMMGTVSKEKNKAVRPCRRVANTKFLEVSPIRPTNRAFGLRSNAVGAAIAQGLQDLKPSTTFPFVFNRNNKYPTSTMSAQTGAGIQELMAAETRASQIVAEARMGKLLSGLCWLRRSVECVIA